MLTHRNSEPSDPARVVVLGAGGFVGQTLCARLAEAGIETLALSSADLDLTAPDAGTKLATLIRTEDALVMLSALTPDRGRGIPPFLANIRMMAAVTSAVAMTAPAQIVYFSSDAVYPMGEGPVSESSCAEAPDLYGTMHHAREVMIAEAYKGALAILRPTLIYGAGDSHNSYGPNRYRRQAANDGRIPLFGEGEETRDHISVDDIATLTLLVLRHRSSGLLNLATGTSTAFGDLARKVAALVDRPVEVAGSPRQNPVTHRHFDVTALHKAFPSFAFTPLGEGLAAAHRDDPVSG